MGHQRGGYTETHTKREAAPAVSRPGIALAVSFSLGFLPKSQKTSTVLNKAKICNGKYKGLALLSQKQYTFENCIVLHKEVKNNTLLKTVLFYTRKPQTHRNKQKPTEEHTQTHTKTHKLTQKHTNTITKAVSFSLGFYHKSQKT